MHIRAGRYAAIDIGTVTCRLLIADVDEKAELSECVRMTSITNLGEGVDASRILRRDAMERVVRALTEFKAEIERWSDTNVTIICAATSAARDAANADELARLLANEGIELSVISGEQEANRSFRGVSRGFSEQQLVVADIGGGSTEIIAGFAGQAPSFSHSFDIGCRRVTEKFFISDPPQSEELMRAQIWIYDIMHDFFDRLHTSDVGDSRMVAVAGTATSVVSILECMAVYDAARVDGSFVSVSDLDMVYHRLASLTREERAQVIGLHPGRAPVIVAGLLILRTIIDLLGVAGFTVSESDILHGTILDAASA